MPKSSKPKPGRSILYVKVASLADLCRYAFSFDFGSRSLISSAGESKIMVLGEQLGETTIVYYVNGESRGSGIIHYTFPSSTDNREKAAFVDSVDEQGKGYMRIISIDLSHFKEAKSAPKDSIMLIKVEKPEDIMAAAIKKAVREESFMYLYSFEYKGKRYLASFDLFDELADDKKALYYAVLPGTKTAGFAKYKYSDNTFEFADTVEEHSYIYVKIINLAEAFNFFKPA